MEMFASAAFWIAVGQIILIDILLGGDNAVVIALACRKLPVEQRTKGILWGTAGAIVLRVVLIFFALQLLAIPLLKVVGALLLLWIGVKLLLPEHDDGGHGSIEGSDKLWGAVKTVIIADFVMSLDNVIAIAGAAESSGTGHSMALVIFGVLISIPIIVWGSQFVIKLMDRFPLIITLGAMLLGWIAGTMAVTDPAFVNPEVWPQVPKFEPSALWRYGAGVAGALLVLLAGRMLSSRQARRASAGAAPAAGLAAAPLRKVLVAVDGSENSLRALRHVLAMREVLKEPESFGVSLINVQRPLSSDVTTHIAPSSVREYHQERSEKALAPARALLAERGLAPCPEVQRVGAPGPTIAEAATAGGFDLIAMGSRGLGSHTAALLGSVAQATVEHAGVPVMLVK